MKQYFVKHFYINNIGNGHACEGKIEKSVPRIAVWNHKACQASKNGVSILRERFFLMPSRTNGGVVLFTIAFHIWIHKFWKVVRC